MSGVVAPLTRLRAGRSAWWYPSPERPRFVLFLHIDVELLPIPACKRCGNTSHSPGIKIYLIHRLVIVPESTQDAQTAKVLKGVAGVEALPTPSEHFPTLISRVKPIYFIWTYHPEVPESGEPFGLDEVLDKLARTKGKLLKGVSRIWMESLRFC